jgi:subfamily B ATP-binding cassette protein MsbA
VEFSGVTFKYGEKTVLDGIDLNVKRGEVLAIVGSSGAGKTTFVNLIPRFYDVQGGSILFDGKDIRELTLKSLRSMIAIVSQQIILFNDTVRNNIAYGAPDSTMEQIERAARAANAHGFISRLPDGYDTLIGEGGVRLSGGERQRLSIARAIYKNAPILILDEATSSLDTESEHEVQKALVNLMEGRTTFVIAHRLSTVRNADRIIVLSGGSIRETGRHDELISQGGEYSRLYTLQFHGGS